MGWRFWQRSSRQSGRALPEWRELLQALKGVAPSANILGQSPALHELEERLAEDSAGIAESLSWISSHAGSNVATASARRIAESPRLTAESLAELAQFHYAEDRYLIGDGLLSRAKQLDPAVLRVFEVEATNQLQRGNLHLEIQAIERCIALSKEAAQRFDWQLRLGQALLRRQDPRSAWTHLSQFNQLPLGDERAYFAASCARQLGILDAASAALRIATANAAGPLARIQAATQFLTRFPSPADAEWVLEGLDAESPTRELELGAQCAFRAGRTDTALERIACASSRSDRGDWVLTYHGMLFELLGRPEEALQVYLSGEPISPLARFRAGTLLNSLGQTERAVKLVLELPSSGTAWSQLAGGEVDPVLLRMLRAGRPLAEVELREVVGRSSSTALRAQAARELAEVSAATGDWIGAWAAVVAAQDLRLPALPLAELDRITRAISPEERYAEFCETEAVDQQTVLYESDLGATTSGDPLALCLERLASRGSEGETHVWSVTSNATLHPALASHPRVRFVRKGSPGYFRLLAIAGTLITNVTQPTEFSKREGQKAVYCWQGSAWGTTGRDRLSSRTAHGNISRNYLHADLVLCPHPCSPRSIARSFDVDELNSAAFVSVIAPRLDLAFSLSDARRRELREAVVAHPRNTLVLYAPFFEGITPDEAASRAREVSESLVGPTISVVIHAQPALAGALMRTSLPQGVSSCAPEVDRSELLGVADWVVSEGSSVLSDAEYLGVPAIALNAPHASPGIPLGDPRAASTRISADVPGTRRSMSEMGAPSAAKQVLDLISVPRETRQQDMASSSAFKLMLSTDGFPENGITQSLRSLLANISPYECSVYLRPWPGALTGAHPEVADEVFAGARVLLGVGRPAGTRMEREALGFFNSQQYVDFPLAHELVRSERRREGRRRFGIAEFDSAVDFSGYLSGNIALVASGIPVRTSRGVIFHNEMWQEIDAKYPQLRAGMSFLRELDFVASVSDGVRDTNREELAVHLGVPRHLHRTVENTLNSRRLAMLAETPLTDADQAWYTRAGVHVCIVARLSAEKNHAEVLRVFAEERATLDLPLLLTIVGSGPLRADLEALVHELALSDAVRFTGQVDAPQSHMRAADVLFLPSLREGQPLVLLEALTVGTPVVATDTPGSNSVLEGGKLGTLVPADRAGIALGLRVASQGDTRTPRAFDADEFSANALAQLYAAIGYEKSPKI